MHGVWPMTGDPTLSVARDLRAIVELSADLGDQAAHKANGEMPGGDALACLAPVASPEAWENRVETIERLWWESDQATRPLIGIDEDANWEPPLQTILFWSEAWRYEHGSVMDARPTVETEAAWLGQIVHWAYEHEPRFEDFERDIRQARARLEAVLYAGERDAHGVAACECGGGLDRLNDEPRQCRCPFRPLPHAWHDRTDRCCIQCWWDTRHALHNQGGLRNEWVCRQCHKTYDRDGYAQLVAKDARDNATALPAVMMVVRFEEQGLTIGQLRMWALRKYVKKHGRDELGRMLYDVADVEARCDEQTLAG